MKKICQVSAVRSPKVLYFIQFILFFSFSVLKNCNSSCQTGIFSDLCKPPSPASPAAPPLRQRNAGASAGAFCPGRTGQKLLEAGRVCPAAARQSGKNAESLANADFFIPLLHSLPAPTAKGRPPRSQRAQGAEKHLSNAAQCQNMQVSLFENSFIGIHLCQLDFSDFVGKSNKIRASFSPFPSNQQSQKKLPFILHFVCFPVKMKVH